jgi:hypothetical protein
MTGLGFPVMAATCCAISSSRPRLPGGFVSESSRARAAAAAEASTGATAAIVSRRISSFMAPLYPNRKTAHHKDHLVGASGRDPVRPSEDLPEPPAQGRLRHDPPPYLVCDDEEGAGRVGDEARNLVEDLPFCGSSQEHLGDEQRQAIDDGGVAPGRQGSGHVPRPLFGAPPRRPLRAVAVDLGAHLFIAGNAGGDEEHTGPCSAARSHAYRLFPLAAPPVISVTRFMER